MAFQSITQEELIQSVASRNLYEYWYILFKSPFCYYAIIGAVLGWFRNRSRSFYSCIGGAVLGGIIFIYIGILYQISIYNLHTLSPDESIPWGERLNSAWEWVIYPLIYSRGFSPINKVLYFAAYNAAVVSSVALYILARLRDGERFALRRAGKRERKGLRHWHKSMRAYERQVERQSRSAVAEATHYDAAPIVARMATLEPAILASAVPAINGTGHEVSSNLPATRVELLPALLAPASGSTTATFVPPPGYVLVPQSMTLSPAVSSRGRVRGILGGIVWFFDIQVAAVRGVLWFVRTAFFLSIPIGLLLAWFFGSSVLSWALGTAVAWLKNALHWPF